MDYPLVVIVGPTASGKTALAIDIAQEFNGEIVCADSRTVYTGMDIGTAKPTKAEQTIVPHYLIDVVKPNEPFSVADFKKLATSTIENIQKRGKLPIMVGGSGLYIDAVLFDYQFSNLSVKRDPRNPRHVSPDVPQLKSKLRPNTIIFGINPELSVIKQRISDRVNAMVDNGFIEEVQNLYEEYGSDTKALQAPGYKAFREYIENKITLDEAKAQFMRNDYLLARRQRTWFKRNKSIHWNSNREEIVELVTTLLNKTL